MPASKGRRRLGLGLLVGLHRWIGVATCLVFTLWFASGAVMLFHPFPSLPHGAQMALQEPIDRTRVSLAPSAAVAATKSQVKDLRLVQRSGEPAYLVGTAARIEAIDAQHGKVLRQLSPEQARAEAERLSGPAASVTGPFDYDQWIVHNRFDPARPFYRIDANDAAGTQLYLSARTGEVLQRTTRSTRAWNWTGAVLHWAYVTPLRKTWSAWDTSVWWLSFVSMLVALTGTVLGLIRWLTARRLKPRRVTFYRERWMRWHHLLGLGTAVFVLGWIFSGWLSMDHGRFFSRGSATDAQAQRYAGCPLPYALQGITPAALTRGHDEREITFTAVACRPIVTHHTTQGSPTRTDAAGKQIDDTQMRRLLAQAVAAGWPRARQVAFAAVPSASTYAMAEGWPDSTWRISLGEPSLPGIYVDANSGRVLTIMDASRKAYAWVYYALHTGNVPGLVSRPWLRRVLVLIPLSAGFLFSLTGLLLGVRRLRRTTGSA